LVAIGLNVVANLIISSTRVKQAERTPGKEREKNLAAVMKLKEEEAKLLRELKKYQDRDPVVLKALSKSPLRAFASTNPS
jgi:hypothetical protein